MDSVQPAQVFSGRNGSRGSRRRIRRMIGRNTMSGSWNISRLRSQSIQQQHDCRRVYLNRYRSLHVRSDRTDSYATKWDSKVDLEVANECAASSKNLRLTSGGFCAVGSQVLCHTRPGATSRLFFPPRSCIRSQNFKAVHRIEQSVSFLLRATVVLRKHQLPLVNCRLCRLNPLLNLRPITFQQSGFVRIVPAIVSRHNAPRREQAAQPAVNRYQLSIVITEQGIWVKPVITVR